MHALNLKDMLQLVVCIQTIHIQPRIYRIAPSLIRFWKVGYARGNICGLLRGDHYRAIRICRCI
jgi:hypothetical protein